MSARCSGENIGEPSAYASFAAASTEVMARITATERSSMVAFQKSPNSAFALHASTSRTEPFAQLRSTAFAFSASSGTTSSARSCVARSLTRGALPASCASRQRLAQRHQRSPAFSPGKP